MFRTAIQGYQPEPNLWQGFNMRRLAIIYIITLLAILNSISVAENINPDSVVQHYIDRGYLDCEFTVGEDSLIVNKGIQYRVDKIILLPADTIFLEKRIIFLKNSLEQVIQSLLQAKISDGYLYQNFSPTEISKDDSTVTIIFAQNEGPRPQIGTISFEGLKQTNEKQLKKYFELEKFSYITEEQMKSIENDAVEIPYITYSPPPLIQLRPGYTEADIILNVKEKRLFALEGTIGYLSDVDEIIWMGDLTLQNLFGKGKKIDIFSQKINTDKQNLSIHYWQPSFLFGVGGIEFSVSTRDYRNQFYEFDMQTEAMYKIRKSLKIGAGLQYKTVEPDSDDGSFSVYAAAFKANYSNSSGIYLKNNQYSIGWELTYSARRSSPRDSLQTVDLAYDDTRIHLEVSYKLPLMLQTSVYNKFQYSGFETKDDLPPLSELFLIGGERTIRGFRDEQFAAIRTLLATTEYHIGFNSGYMFTFLDAAYLYNRIDENSTTIDDEYYRFGYGIGILIENRGREFRISFGWNKDLPFDQPRLSVQFQTGL